MTGDCGSHCGCHRKREIIDETAMKKLIEEDEAMTKKYGRAPRGYGTPPPKGHYPCAFCGQICKSLAGLKNHWRAAKTRELGVEDRPHDDVEEKYYRDVRTRQRRS